MSEPETLQVKDTEWIVPQVIDEGAEGRLDIVEFERTIPTTILRTYFITDVPEGVDRGAHAHKEATQYAFCISGSCDMMLDDTKVQQVVELTKAKGILKIGPMVWHEMSQFSSDCVLVVFSDAYYDEADYIRDKEIFKAVAS